MGSCTSSAESCSRLLVQRTFNRISISGFPSCACLILRFGSPGLVSERPGFRFPDKDVVQLSCKQGVSFSSEKNARHKQGSWQTARHRFLPSTRWWRLQGCGVTSPPKAALGKCVMRISTVLLLGGPYTVFAPTDSAFAALDRATLEAGFCRDRHVSRSHGGNSGGSLARPYSDLRTETCCNGF